MAVMGKVLMTSVLLCGLFACMIFVFKLSGAFFVLVSSKSTRLIGKYHEPFVENITKLSPGLNHRLYRQGVYSKALNHHNRYLYTPRKYRVTNLQKKIGSFKRVCYYTVPTEEWPVLFPRHIDIQLCTHIIVGFAQIVDQHLVPERYEHEIIYQEMIRLKELSPDLHILLSVGGANNDKGFHDVIVNLKSREEFAIHSANYLKAMGFDGLDLDWEFPAWYTPFEERFLFLMFLQEMYEVYKNPVYDLILSVAVAAPKSIVDRSYRVAQMAKYVDFVNLMGYDLHSYKWYLPLTGHNSPLYQRSDEWSIFSTANLNWTAYYWVQLGMPKDKLVIGIPTYGQTYQLYSPSLHGVYAPAVSTGTIGINGQIPYPAVCQFLREGGTREFDGESKVPYAYQNSTWISYDDEQSLQEKAKWISDNQFGGVMMFDLNCDDFIPSCSNVSFPLIKSILRGLGI